MIASLSAQAMLGRVVLTLRVSDGLYHIEMTVAQSEALCGVLAHATIAANTMPRADTLAEFLG